MFVFDGQISMMDYLMDTEPRPVRIDKPIRLIELFGGIGAQASALENLSAKGLLPHGYELYRYVEWDKYAVQSYNAMHGTNEVPRDINDVHGDDLGIVDTDKFFYIFFYSFPCTDLSVAGKGQGMEEGSGTRSSLLWQCKRLLGETKNLPQCCIMENVPQVHGTKNQEPWNKWLRFMESLGYRNYWQDMNAKDYGIAQSRNRTFLVSLLGNYTFRFPEKIPLTFKMKDYLEPYVDERYYLKNDKARELIDKLIVGGKILKDKKSIQTVYLCFTHGETVDVANAILARYDGGIWKHHNERSGVLEPERIEKPTQETITMNMKNVGGGIDTAVTLCARDWRGFSYGLMLQNGVVEYDRIEDKRIDSPEQE